MDRKGRLKEGALMRGSALTLVAGRPPESAPAPALAADVIDPAT